MRPCLPADEADSILNNLMRWATAYWGHRDSRVGYLDGIQPCCSPRSVGGGGPPQNPRHRSDEKHRVSVPFPPLSSGRWRHVSSMGERGRWLLRRAPPPWRSDRVRMRGGERGASGHIPTVQGEAPSLVAVEVACCLLRVRARDADGGIHIFRPSRGRRGDRDSDSQTHRFPSRQRIPYPARLPPSIFLRGI